MGWTRDGLLARWETVARAHGAYGDVRGSGEDLLRRWGEPHRVYHDVRHLAEVLEGVDGLAGHASDPDTVRLAAWFHDAVYDPRASDSEERSAVLAERVLAGLGVPGAEVARLVRLTAGHDPTADDADGQVLADADLAILAADSDRYAGYAAAVRREYAHVPAAAFAVGRAAVLRRLLAAPRLFRTPAAAPWEAPARANVARELSALDAAAARPPAGA